MGGALGGPRLWTLVIGREVWVGLGEGRAGGPRHRDRSARQPPAEQGRTRGQTQRKNPTNILKTSQFTTHTVLSFLRLENFAFICKLSCSYKCSICCFPELFAAVTITNDISPWTLMLHMVKLKSAYSTRTLSSPH